MNESARRALATPDYVNGVGVDYFAETRDLPAALEIPLAPLPEGYKRVTDGHVALNGAFETAGPPLPE